MLCKRNKNLDTMHIINKAYIFDTRVRIYIPDITIITKHYTTAYSKFLLVTITKKKEK